MQEVEALLVECRQLLLEKQKACTTNQLSVIQHRSLSLDNFEQMFQARLKNPLYEKEVIDNFRKELLLIKEEIEAI